MASVLSLDVGCGNRKMGDVNVDIRREVKPDVVCDIHHLPFKDDQFSHVYCYHVLEHKGINPAKALKELLRVSNGIVEIQVPHWLSPNAKKDKEHTNFHVMHRKWWMQFNPTSVTIDYTYLFPFIPFLMRPNNITVTLRKRHVRKQRRTD
jgi:ubiquinone/menaquinone biosynthesis C-methylase UbiE